jgi:hypothetical protein
MTYFFRTVVLLLFFLPWFTGCHPSASTNTNRSVYVKLQNGKYILYRKGKPYLVKGGSGYTNLKALSLAGGNTIRVWDTVNLAKILDSAQACNLAVIVGLDLPDNKNMDAFYNRGATVNNCFKSISATVNTYKNHPALLCWCLGNELDFPFKPNYNNFYKAFNHLVDMIHVTDPNHPVTTTVMTFNRKYIANIKWRTNIDFISFNIFGSIQTLKSDLKNFNWFWSGPFLISEWGIEGPWVAQLRNAWGAYFEDSSPKKAEKLLTVYKQSMPVNDAGFLGEMIFYWGQKQELTPTWFSLFDEHGAPTQMVSAMQYIWTGKAAVAEAPAIKYMLINSRGGHDNILLKPNILADAQLLTEKPDTAGLNYKWQLLPEDWYNPNGKFSVKKPLEISGAITSRQGARISFKTPLKEGPYRLLVYVYNKQGYVATSNTPFYVVSNP